MKRLEEEQEPVFEERKRAKGDHNDYLHERVKEMNEHGCALTDRYDPHHPQALAIFSHALVLALEVDPYIVAQVGNLDFLRRPTPESDATAVNCLQLLTLDIKGVVSIEAVLGFICCAIDRSGEPYEHSEAMKNAIRETLHRIAQKHANAHAYFVHVSRNLWRDDRFLIENVCDSYVQELNERLSSLRQGEGCVFDHFDEDGKDIYV